MIIIGPLAFLCLLCVLLLFFRPIRLLAGSVLLTVVVIALRYTGANAEEHVALGATILVTQAIYWVLISASGANKRKRHAQEIADAVNAGLARHGIGPPPNVSRDQEERAGAMRTIRNMVLIAIPTLAIVYWLNREESHTNSTASTYSPPAPVASAAQTDTPIAQPRPTKNRHKRTAESSPPPSVESQVPARAPIAMPMADPSPGAEPPR